MESLVPTIQGSALGRAALARPRLAGLLILGAFLVPMLLITVGTLGPMIDIDVYLLAGREFFGGRGLYQDGFGSTLPTPLPYTYPPLWAAVVGMFAWLPWRGVAWGWTLLNVALFVWLVRRSYDAFVAVRPEIAPSAAALFAGVLAFTAPVMGTFDVGQVGILLTAAVVADVVPSTTRVPRGMLVGSATAIKLTPGIFVVYWLLTKRWRAAITASLTALGLWAVVAVLRPELSREYWFHVAFNAQRTTDDMGIVINQSLSGLLHRIGWDGAVVWGVLAGAALVIGLVRARAAHRAGDELAAVALVGLAGLLVSPVSWIHHAVWIVPVTGVLLGDGRSRRQWIAWGGVVLVFLLRLPLWAWSGAIPTNTLTAFVFENAYVWAYGALLVFLPITRVRRAAETVPLPSLGS
jgi:alpha-1,2-mannosyltransferase